MKKLCFLACALFCLSACQPAMPAPSKAQPIGAAAMPPSLTSTATQTALLSPAPSHTPHNTPTPTATAIATDTPSITPSPTATATPTVTRTPTPAADAVTASAANLRSGPGEDFELLGSYKQGTPLTLISRLASSEWVEASLPDGEQGWMHAGLLQINIPLESVPVNPNPPTRAYNMPGIYDLEDQCIRIYVDEAYADECLWSVEVRDDGRMQLNFRWSAAHVKGTRWDYLIKYCDEGNRNMYITDNQGNRYDHVEIGGAARGDHKMYEGQSVEGWFLFEPAKPGATAFTFHDDDQGKTFDGIVLLP